MTLKENTDEANIMGQEVWTRNIRSYRLLSLMLLVSGAVSAGMISFALQILQ